MTKTSVLAMETSVQPGSVALLDGDQLLYQRTLENRLRTAQTLVPEIAAGFAEVGWSAAVVDLVAVDVGPGSFTGLRIGMATAKTFAYAANCAIVGVSALDVLACQFETIAPEPEGELRLHVIVDAQRGDSWIVTYVRTDSGALIPQSPGILIGDDEMIASWKAGDWVTGPGLHKQGGQLRSRIGSDIRIAPEELWNPHAEALGQLAAREHAEGRRDNLWSLVPQYYRKSAAEEKAENFNQGLS